MLGPLVGHTEQHIKNSVGFIEMIKDLELRSPLWCPRMSHVYSPVPVDSTVEKPPVLSGSDGSVFDCESEG